MICEDKNCSWSLSVSSTKLDSMTEVGTTDVCADCGTSTAFHLCTTCNQLLCKICAEEEHADHKMAERSSVSDTKPPLSSVIESSLKSKQSEEPPIPSQANAVKPEPKDVSTQIPELPSSQQFEIERKERSTQLEQEGSPSLLPKLEQKVTPTVSLKPEARFPQILLRPAHISSLRRIIRDELGFRIKRQEDLKDPDREGRVPDFHMSKFLLRILEAPDEIRVAISRLQSTIAARTPDAKLDLHVRVEPKTDYNDSTCSSAGDVFPIPADDSTEAELGHKNVGKYASIALYLPIDDATTLDDLNKSLDFCREVEEARLITGVATLLIHQSERDMLKHLINPEFLQHLGNLYSKERKANLQFCVGATYTGVPRPDRRRICLPSKASLADLKAKLWMESY